MATRHGKLIVISAPSGCGKTTIVERLLRRSKNLKRSISYTTRPPRPGEVDGRDYRFVSEEEFSSRKQNGFFLESAKVFGHWYGTSKEYVRDQTSRGVDLVLAIDVQGVKQLSAGVKKEIPMTSIFIMPPSVSVLRRRLEKRRTETKAQIRQRLKIAREEIAARSLYDFIVVNRKVDQAVKEIKGMVQ